MKPLVALLVGTIFGAGLAISEMLNPQRVLGFLDIAGQWDPTLAFVMAGALLVAGPGTWFVRRRAQAVLGGNMELPTKTTIDRPLVLGSTLFGIGWGLVGFCPGPALAALGVAPRTSVLFVLTMILGSWLHEKTVKG